VIREPSPCLHVPSPITSPQAGVLAVRPVTANSKEVAQQPSLLPVTAAAVRPSINQPDITQKAVQITVELVVDEEARLPKWVQLLNPHA